MLNVGFEFDAFFVLFIRFAQPFGFGLTVYYKCCVISRLLGIVLLRTATENDAMEWKEGSS